jgi:hypothetical protein
VIVARLLDNDCNISYLFIGMSISVYVNVGVDVTTYTNDGPLVSSDIKLRLGEE